MKQNILKISLITSIFALGLVGNAQATIYNFSDGATNFATLDVNAVSGSATQYTFNLSFLNTTTNLGANHFISLLGVDNANGIDSGAPTSYDPTPAASSLAPTIATTSAFGSGYDFDFVFSSATGVENRLGVNNSASWTSNFATAPGVFNNFQLRTVNTNGNGAREFIGVAVAAVPEPETYGMMLLGLGLLGFVARRKQA